MFCQPPEGMKHGQEDALQNAEVNERGYLLLLLSLLFN